MGFLGASLESEVPEETKGNVQVLEGATDRIANIPKVKA